MTRNLEHVVDLLRRAGPGALPLAQVRRELRRRIPHFRPSTAMLRALAENSDGRILLLEARLDEPSFALSGPDVLVAWMVLMWPGDEPDQSRLASQLWRSLATLADEVDTTSRAEVCRWALQARQAHLALHQTLLAARRNARWAQRVLRS